MVKPKAGQVGGQAPGAYDLADQRYMTTATAARYCGYKDSEGLRKAHQRGKVKPIGRRGGTGTLMWCREDLDRFLRGGGDAAEGDAADARAEDAAEARRDRRRSARRHEGDAPALDALERIRRVTVGGQDAFGNYRKPNVG